MQAFEYFAPRTLPEAADLLARHGDQARAVAGGTDLLLKMKAGRLRPRVIVNLKRLAELRGLDFNGHLTLGALTTLEALRRSPVIRRHYPALAEASASMASPQIRNLATVGGNLCNAAPSADLAPILLALDARARLAGPQGERRVPLDEFFTGPGRTVLQPGELLVALEVPPPAGRALYLKLAPRQHMDIAVVGLGLRLQVEAGRCVQARLALGAVAPVPLRVPQAGAELEGSALTPERIARAAQLAAEAAQPIDDLRGSAWYRRRMVGVLARRGLEQLAAASGPA